MSDRSLDDSLEPTDEHVCVFYAAEALMLHMETMDFPEIEGRTEMKKRLTKLKKAVNDCRFGKGAKHKW